MVPGKWKFFKSVDGLVLQRTSYGVVLLFGLLLRLQGVVSVIRPCGGLLRVLVFEGVFDLRISHIFFLLFILYIFRQIQIPRCRDEEFVFSYEIFRGLITQVFLFAIFYSKI